MNTRTGSRRGLLSRPVISSVMWEPQDFQQVPTFISKSGNEANRLTRFPLKWRRARTHRNLLQARISRPIAVSSVKSWQDSENACEN